MNSSEVNWDVDRPETFVILGAEFDICEAKRIIVAAPRAVGSISVNGFRFCSRWVATFWRLEKDADIEIPIILCTLGAGSLLIDGWHRLHRAEKKGIADLPYVHLNPAETSKIMKVER